MALKPANEIIFSRQLNVSNKY